MTTLPHQIRAAFKSVGIIYSPTSEMYPDGGEISWPHCWHAAQTVHANGTEYSAEMPAVINWGTGEMVIVLEVSRKYLEIDNVYALPIDELLDKVAGFIAGYYWADAAATSTRSFSAQ